MLRHLPTKQPTLTTSMSIVTSGSGLAYKLLKVGPRPVSGDDSSWGPDQRSQRFGFAFPDPDIDDR